MSKRSDEYMNQVVWYGGLPLRWGDVIRYLDEVAKKIDPKNYMRLRDAGLMGLRQYHEMHGYPPKGTQPLTLTEFKAYSK